MAKKGFMALVMAVLVAGGAFAQSDFESMAKNSVTVDVGPTIVGLAFGKAADLIKEEGIGSSGFGIAGQYERQLSRPLSVAARFSYLTAGMGIAISKTVDDGSGELTADLSLVSFSAEGHVRLYPFGKTFFLDGMVGYANLKTDFSGKIKTQETGHPPTTEEFKPFSASRNYVKLGAKLGWRISYGKNGGFTFEPAIGYSYGIGLDASIGKKLAGYVTDELLGDGDASSINHMFPILENFVFIGGPRVTLAFGYRF